MTKICKSCEREFQPSSRHRDCPICRAEQQKHRCECGELIARASTQCVPCSNASREPTYSYDNPNFDCKPHTNGYSRIYCGDEGMMFEHRWVMEKHLGRRLRPTESVHHINGVRTDNRLDNLELWSSSHPAGQRVSDKIDWAIQLLQEYKPEALSNNI